MAPDESEITCFVHRFSSFKPDLNQSLARRCQVEIVYFFAAGLFCIAGGVLLSCHFDCNMDALRIALIFAVRNKKEINE